MGAEPGKRGQHDATGKLRSWNPSQMPISLPPTPVEAVSHPQTHPADTGNGEAQQLESPMLYSTKVGGQVQRKGSVMVQWAGPEKRLSDGTVGKAICHQE